MQTNIYLLQTRYVLCTPLSRYVHLHGPIKRLILDRVF